MNKSDAAKGSGAAGRANLKSTRRITETAYDDLKFNKEMSYDQRSRVRNVCMTFLRFSFLVDFIALDALTKVYVNSVSELRDRFYMLSIQEAAKPLTDVEKARANFGGKSPMFEVQVQFIENSPAEKPEIVDTVIPFFEMPENQEASAAEFAGFNIIAHPFLINFNGDMDRIQTRQI